MSFTAFRIFFEVVYGTSFLICFLKNRVFLPMIEAKIEARKIAKKFGIKTQKDWSEDYSAGQIPKNLPSSLWNVYKRDAATKKRLREKRRRK